MTITDTQLKAKHRATWALGDYPRVARELIWSLGPILTEYAGVRAGDSVLDVAAGSGNASIAAARAGARVVASDLTPALLEAGQATIDDPMITWRVADAEDLPFGDGEFDRVISCVGVMFAPHHERAGAELVRVTRPGGTIGLLSWTPDGFIGQLFATMKPFAPAPPAGVQPPPLWGSPDHVEEVLGGRARCAHERRSVAVPLFDAAPEAFREFFKANYGPTVAVYAGLADAPERSEELDAALDALVASAPRDEHGSMTWDYLLTRAEVG